MKVSIIKLYIKHFQIIETFRSSVLLLNKKLNKIFFRHAKPHELQANT